MDNYDIQIIQDPVLFCETFFHHPLDGEVPLKLKWWQKQLIRTQKRFNAVRIRRRIGKTVTVVLWVLHKCITVKNFRVVLVTPGDSQVAQFWEQIEHQLQNSVFKNSYHGRLKPFRFIEFSNGSTIKGFCTGLSVRSHGCDTMIVEEADHFEDRDWSAFTPLWGEKLYLGELTEDELKELGAEDKLGSNVIVFMTTTLRSGHRGKFYHFCTNKDSPFIGPEGRDWSFPADEDPDMKEEDLQNLRTTLTEEEYENEVLCRWGTAMEGVYRHKYIERSIYPGQDNEAEHRHAIILPDSEFLFDPTDRGLHPNSALGSAPPSQLRLLRRLGPGPTVIGADWDKSPKHNLGPCIYAVQYDMDPTSPFCDKFKTLFSYQFQYTQFCVTGAVHLISQLYDLVKPTHIYLERGGGGDSQEEFLAILAHHQHKDQMAEITRVVGFNDAWDVQHPITGIESHVQVKQWMVFTCSVLTIEQGRVVLSEVDDDRLVVQLRNYRKIGETRAGWKFNDDDEHLVDAFNLCLLAIIHEVNPHWANIDVEGHIEIGPPLLKEYEEPGRDTWEIIGDMANRSIWSSPSHVPGPDGTEILSPFAPQMSRGFYTRPRLNLGGRPRLNLGSRSIVKYVHSTLD